MTTQNNYLQKWLEDRRDDLTPYYINKLEFVRLYGTRCRTQEPTTPEQCEAITNNDECIGGRELYCQYSNDKCSGIVDSICNYYDASGNYIEDRFTEVQVNYLDTLYKMAGISEFGKALKLYFNGEAIDVLNQTIKTNAFQVIYDKFNVGYEGGQDKSSCYNAINNLMVGDAELMQDIHEQRQVIFSKFDLPYVAEDNNYIKLPELAIYVFEVLLNKKSPTLFRRRRTIFPHNKVLDNQIIEVLNTVGTCFQTTSPKSGEKTIPHNLALLSVDDFVISSNSVLYNVVIKTVNFARNTTFYIGNVAVSMAHFLIKNYKYIVIACMAIVLLREVLQLLVDISRPIDAAAQSEQIINSATGFIAKMVGNKNNDYLLKSDGFTLLKNLIDKLKPVMPYINNLYVHIRNLLCVLMPIITSERLIQSDFGLWLGEYIAKIKTFGYNGLIPPDFLVKLGSNVFTQFLLQFLKQGILQCDKTIRAIGQNRDIVYVSDKETDFQRWSQHFITQIKDGTTQPQFRFFMHNLLEDPLSNIRQLFLVLAACFNILARNAIESTDETTQIAQEGLEFTYALMQGPFALETGVMSLGESVIRPVRSTIADMTISTVGFTEVYLNLCTINALWFVAVASGAVVGYVSSPVRQAHEAGIEQGRKEGRTAALAESRVGGKKRSKKRSKMSARKISKSKRRTHRRKHRNTRRK